MPHTITVREGALRVSLIAFNIIRVLRQLGMCSWVRGQSARLEVHGNGPTEGGEGAEEGARK